MKTRLLIILFFVSFANYAQINASENFNSLSVIPPTWTSQNFFIYTGAENCDGTQVPKATIYGSSNIATLTSPSYVSDGNQISVSIKYKAILASSFSGQVSVAYEVNNSNSWVPLFSDSFFDATCRDLVGYISPNVVAAGSSVRFRFSAIRNAGQADILFDNFAAIQSTPTLLTEYTFDNVLHNTAGNNPFGGSTLYNFTNDRNGNLNRAIVLPSSTAGLSANIPSQLLPTGNDRRTISVWYSINTSSPSFTGIFTYGDNNVGSRFGVYLGPSGNPYFQRSGTDINFFGNYPAYNWYHLVVSYDKTNVKMYVNGILLGTQPTTISTAFSSFSIANSASAQLTLIDDLKIYDGPLTNEQVLSLYTNNTILSSSNFSQNNLDVKLYPNPVRDILNIEIENDIQSIEIYNIQGQKVLSSNQKQINVSDLATGMYMVRIQDIDNNIATKKIVIK